MHRRAIQISGEALRLPQNATPFGKGIEAAVYLLLALFFAYVSVMLFCSLAGTLRAVLSVLAVLAAFALCAFGLGRLRFAPGRTLVLILLLAAALRTVWIFTVKTQPSSDFALLYETALEAAQGNFDWAHETEGYFSWWQYQIPFVLYEALVLKLCPSMAALKLLNAVWSVGIVYLLYRIAAGFLPARCALAAAFLYAVHPGQLALASVLTNQHIAMFFLLLGLAVLLEARSLWGCVSSGCLLALANLMRPEAPVLLAAIFCVALCGFLSRPEKRRGAALLLCFFTVLAAYVLTGKAAELLLGLAGVAPYGLGNSYPEWKFVVGLNTQTFGTVTDQDIYLLSIKDPALVRAESVRLIRGYLEQCENLPAFFRTKLDYFWLSPDTGDWAMAGLRPWDTAAPGLTLERLFNLLNLAELSERLLIYALCTAGCVLLARAALKDRSRCAAAPLIAAALVCGTVLIYLVIEIQPRYRYLAFPFLCLLACVPFARTWRKTE